MGRIVEAYLDDRQDAGIASSDRQRNAWKAMKPFWADISPQLIDTQMARTYDQQRNRAAATVRYELGMLAVALRWAKATRLIDDAPQIWRPDPPERRTRHLTRPQFRKLLEAAHRARTCDFVIERGGLPIKSIKKAFAAASRRSAVKATPYTLRHTGTVWRAEDGIPMAELAQLLGHDDSRTTEKHYARFSPEYLRKAANAGHW